MKTVLWIVIVIIVGIIIYYAYRSYILNPKRKLDNLNCIETKDGVRCYPKMPEYTGPIKCILPDGKNGFIVNDKCISEVNYYLSLVSDPLIIDK